MKKEEGEYMTRENPLVVSSMTLEAVLSSSLQRLPLGRNLDDDPPRAGRTGGPLRFIVP